MLDENWLLANTLVGMGESWQLDPAEQTALLESAQIGYQLLRDRAAGTPLPTVQADAIDVFMGNCEGAGSQQVVQYAAARLCSLRELEDWLYSEYVMRKQMDIFGLQRGERFTPEKARAARMCPVGAVLVYDTLQAAAYLLSRGGGTAAEPDIEEIGPE
jgi:hypothetical protein